MKKQEIFDTVVSHLRSMPQRSATSLSQLSGNNCLYRGPIVNDVQLKCALGILIPDEKYVQEMEGKPATLVIDQWHLTFLSRNTRLVYSLQLIHDENRNWSANGFNEQGEKDLKLLEKEFRVRYTPPTLPEQNSTQL